MEWNNKPEVKKGSIGERIVNEILTRMDYIVYRPITDGAHKVDFFAHKIGTDKNIVAVEAKAKRRMAKYTQTGFNYSNFLHYKELYDKNGIDTYVFFIDNFEGGVYGAWLSELGEGSRFNGRGTDVNLWNLKLMRPIRKLTPAEIEELSRYTKECYSYTATTKFFDWDNLKLSFT